MKNLLLLLCFMCVSFAGMAQGIKFENGTWEDVLAKAKSENKVIFVDVFTQWCGPCKMVAKTVFPQEKVGEFYNANFINYQIDAESAAGKEFVKKHPVAAYPTFFFLNGQDELVMQSGGAQDMDMFIQTGKQALIYAKYGGLEKMEQLIAQGSTDKNLLKDYYEMAPSFKKPAALNACIKAFASEEFADVDELNALLDQMSLYDIELMNQLVDGIVKNSQPNKCKDKEYAQNYISALAFPIEYRISLFLEESINQGNEQQFKELLSLKEKLNSNGIPMDSDLKLMAGRGLFFATPEYLNLCYWTKNGENQEGFNSALSTYMNDIMHEIPVDSLLKEQSCQVAMEQIKALKTGEISFNIPLPEEMKKKIVTDPLIYAGAYTTPRMLEWIHYFWTLAPSNKKMRETCTEWAKYAFYINPYNASMAIPTADLLARLGNFDEAQAVLEKALACQKEINANDPLVNRAINMKLYEVERKKL